METTLGFLRRQKGQFLFVACACLLASACSQNESAPPAEVSTQSEGIERWMERRTERREAALSNPKEVVIPVAKALPVQIKNPVTITKVAPAVPALAPIKAENEFPKGIQPITRPSLPKSTGRSLAAEASDISSQLKMGYSAWTQGDYDEAFRWFIKAAEFGSAEAQLSVGMMYVSGEGTPQNYEEGLKWIASALSKGDLTAEQLLGLKQFLNALQELGIAEEQQAIANTAPTFNSPFSTSTGVTMTSASAPSTPLVAPHLPMAARSVEFQELAKRTERALSIPTVQAAAMESIKVQLGNSRYNEYERRRTRNR